MRRARPLLAGTPTQLTEVLAEGLGAERQQAPAPPARPTACLFGEGFPSALTLTTGTLR